MKKQYLRAKREYYAGTPIMTDAEFDALEDKLKAKYPNWAPLHETGYKGKKEKVKLPCFLPSLSKVYPEDFPKLKLTAKSYVIMDKLDGSSVALKIENGKPTGLFTRGDGEYGGDISFLLRHLKFPKAKGDLIIRMEAVMPKSTYVKKYSEEFDSARNLVAGILNRTEENLNVKHLQDIHFVALGVIGESVSALDGLQDLGFHTVERTLVSANNLESTLRQRISSQGTYEKDGLVVIPSKQKLAYKDTKRPKFTFAYKDNNELENAQLTTVTDVIWQVSSKGRLTPKVEVAPVKFDNVTVKYVTVNNSKWMQDRGIGVNAQVLVVRSGEVIPKIVGVKKKGKFVAPSVPYELRGVHFVAKEDSREIQVKQVVRFLTCCGVETVKEGVVSKLKLRPTIPNYVLLANKDYSEVEKILGVLGKRAGKQAYLALQGLRKIEVVSALDGWNQFGDGVGRTRLDIVSRKYGLLNILEGKYTGDLTAEGIGKVTAARLKEGIAIFGETIYPKLKPYLVETITEQEVVEGRFSGKLARWTGYRSKEEEALWVSEGGVVSKSKKNLDYVFYKEGGRMSSTLKSAGDKAVLFKDLFGE